MDLHGELGNKLDHIKSQVMKEIQRQFDSTKTYNKKLCFDKATKRIEYAVEKNIQDYKTCQDVKSKGINDFPESKVEIKISTNYQFLVKDLLMIAEYKNCIKESEQIGQENLRSTVNFFGSCTRHVTPILG